MNPNLCNTARGVPGRLAQRGSPTFQPDLRLAIRSTRPGGSFSVCIFLLVGLASVDAADSVPRCSIKDVPFSSLSIVKKYPSNGAKEVPKAARISWEIKGSLKRGFSLPQVGSELQWSYSIEVYPTGQSSTTPPILEEGVTEATHPFWDGRALVNPVVLPITLAPNRKYSCTAYLRRGSCRVSAYVKTTFATELASLPVFPPDGQSDLPSQLWLEWSSAGTGLTRYEVELFDSAGTRTPVTIQAHRNGLSRKVRMALLADEKYEWRVRGYRTRTGYTAWPERNWSFTTSKDRGPAVQPSIYDEAFGVGQQVFRWPTHPRAKSYKLTGSRDGSYAFGPYFPIIPKQASATFIEHAVTLQAGTYEWRVIGTDETGRDIDVLRNASTKVRPYGQY
jgi:hypothetical protein